MRSVFAIALSVLIWVNAQAQSIESKLDSIFQVHDLMGVSVQFTFNDSLVLNYTNGVANQTLQTNINDSTYFRIASVSKTFVAAAIMKLQEQSLLNISDDISTILGYTLRNPKYPSVIITPKMLMNHSSSIQDGFGYSSFSSNSYQNPGASSIEELLSPTGSDYDSTCWRSEPPGSYFKYSNLNFGVLATVIEKASGLRFDEYIRINLLQPLGIKGDFNIWEIDDTTNIAALYRKPGVNWIPQNDDYSSGMGSQPDFTNYIPGTNGLIFSPQGGLRINSKDLTKWMLVLSNLGEYNGVRILDDTSVYRMRFPYYCFSCTNSGDPMGGFFNSYGLGLHLTTAVAGQDLIFTNIEMMGHPGEAYGLLSDLYFDPKGLFGLIFITNGVGAGYQYGNQSLYYKCEEDVFQLLYTEFVTMGLDESKQEVNFNLYPNPVNNSFRIELPYFSDWTVELYDSKSTKISEETYQSGSNIIFNSDNLENGIYFLKITDKDGNSSVQKLIRI